MTKPRLVGLFACLLVGAVLAPNAVAQEPIAEWLFDNEAEGFASTNPEAQLTNSVDELIVREEGNGVLQLAYTPTKDAFNGFVGQPDAGLAGGKSLVMHIRSTAQTAIMVALNEGDGSSYNCVFTSLPDRWQEVALDFSEFALGDRSTDENNQLDADQVSRVIVADNVRMQAGIADMVPIFVPPALSPRMLWLDDMWVDSEGTPPRWVRTETGVQLDSFESGPLQWACLTSPDTELAYDQERKADGDFSLRIAYNLPPGKLHVYITKLGAVPLEGMKVLGLSYVTEKATTLMLEIEELDGSKYRAFVPAVASGRFNQINLAVAKFKLGDDSQDENGRLDLTQTKQVVVGDLSALTGESVGKNTLWLDNITFGEGRNAPAGPGR